MKWKSEKNSEPLAIIYLNAFHLFHTQVNRDSLLGKDNLTITIGTPETLLGTPPDGLEWRSPDAVRNLMGFAATEANKVGYKVEIVTENFIFGQKFHYQELDKVLNRLDRGQAQAFISFAEMVPPSISIGGVPSPTAIQRAEDNNWRLILINQFVDPEISHSLWKTEFLHLTKNDKSFGVMIFARDPYASGNLLKIGDLE